MSAAAIRLSDPSGFDSDGNQYKSISEMWAQELQTSKKNKSNRTEAEKRWYSGGAAYWKTEEASMDGMLGGLTQVHGIDTTISKSFIKSLQGDKMLALDCGAGIGRVTEHVLGDIYKTVDVLEQNEKYIQKAKELLQEKSYMGDFYTAGLQEFEFPKDKKYDMIWLQWVLPHLTDDDLVTFLQKCKDSITESGYIVAKENNCRQGFYLDKSDFSVTRSDEYYRQVFETAGFTVFKSQLQPGFPKQLFPVTLYALRPSQNI